MDLFLYFYVANFQCRCSFRSFNWPPEVLMEDSQFSTFSNDSLNISILKLLSWNSFASVKRSHVEYIGHNFAFCTWPSSSKTLFVLLSRRGLKRTLACVSCRPFLVSAPPHHWSQPALVCPYNPYFSNQFVSSKLSTQQDKVKNANSALYS